jgi:adenylosuccinate synthase
MGEMLHISSFRSNLKKKLEDQEILLKKLFGITPEWDISTIIEEYSSYAEQLGPYIVDTAVLINKAIRQGKKVLIESAQGTMLDLDFGTYPYVTSCSSLTGGASAGLGIAPGLISQNLGIFKAYTTRVGEGPFPTEVHGPIGKILQESGNEFGSTTGRPRRCGWLDLPALQYAIMLNGIQDLAMMKLDVLDKLDSIKICTEYRKDTVPMENYPSFPEDYDSLEPHFIELEGWNSTTRNCKNFDDLPQKAQQYITSIEKYLGKAIRFISLGPDRKDTIER